ncbi:hypothetical protein GDO78_010597 [Eleutherodactylus coqui]|uniref:Uncharacterized protein n=1 Tax=Eleutherodactylus coqui TaxID=57060 RepID=A0A8J6F6J7_ELECQ|nr:hypothetical protein GDO78_010597 [Eleutherodactylus coqui]
MIITLENTILHVGRAWRRMLFCGTQTNKAALGQCQKAAEGQEAIAYFETSSAGFIGNFILLELLLPSHICQSLQGLNQYWWY